MNFVRIASQCSQDVSFQGVVKNSKANPKLSVGMCVVALMMMFVNQANLDAATKVKTIVVPQRGQPMVAKTDLEGTIHLVFDTSDGPQYVNSKDNGVTLSKPIAIVDQSSRKPGLEFITWDMVVSADGTVHIGLGNNAWKLKLPQDEWGYFYARLMPKAKVFSPLKNINHKPSEGFSLAARDKDTVTAVWMADKLYANISRDGGTTFAKTMEIDAKLNPCNCCTTSSVYGADGRLAILYREETDNDRDMYLALWDQEHNQVTKTRVSTTPWKIDSCPMTYYSVVQNGKGFVAAWPTKGQIYFAKLDSDGTPIAPEEIKTPGSCGMRTGLLAIPSTDGKALIVWNKDHQLGWQLYDDHGRPSGAPGIEKITGNGVAGVLARNGELILFR